MTNFSVQGLKAKPSLDSSMHCYQIFFYY